MKSFEGLRVAFLLTHIIGGGTEKVTLAVAKRFAKWKIVTTFICQSVRDSEFVIPEEVKAIYQEQIGRDNAEIFYFLPNKKDIYARENKDAISIYLQEQGIAVLFTNYLDGAFFADKFGSANCRMVNWHHTMPFFEKKDKAEWIWRRTFFSKKWWFCWNLLGLKYYYNSFLFLQPLYGQYKKDIRSFDNYIVLCEEYKREFCETLEFSRDDANRIFSVTNTIEIKEEQVVEKKKCIVWVGRLIFAPKRYDRMLEVWRMVQSELPEWTLRFYGSGDDISGLIKQNGLDRVEVCGFTNDMAQIYDEAAVLCSTSTYEGWPMVVAEAQSNGVVPISFDCCKGVHSMLGSTVEAGVLVEPFDLKAYAHALVRLCKDEDYRARLQANCLEKRREYAPDVNDATWQAFFSSLSDSK